MSGLTCPAGFVANQKNSLNWQVDPFNRHVKEKCETDGRWWIAKIPTLDLHIQ